MEVELEAQEYHARPHQMHTSEEMAATCSGLSFKILPKKCIDMRTPSKNLDFVMFLEDLIDK